LANANLVYVRSADMKRLLKLRTQITGLVGLLTLGDSQRIRDVLPIEDSYVQELIKTCEREFHARSKGVKVGTFVRVVGGDMQGFCGYVEKITGDRATVFINLGVKLVRVHTPVKNLLNLDHVKKNRRVYFYGVTVEDMEHPKHLVPYMSEDKPKIDMAAPAKQGPKHNNCITKLITNKMKEGIFNPNELAMAIFTSLSDPKMRPPVSLYVILVTIKNTLKSQMRREGFKTWKDMMKFHPEYRMTFKSLCRLAEKHGVNLPPYTEVQTRWMKKNRYTPRKPKPKDLNTRGRGRPRKVVVG